MKTIVQSMNSAECREPFDVFDNALKKVVPNALLYLIVEVTCSLDVFRCFLQDNDSFHDFVMPSRPLSSSSVRNFP